MVSNLDDSLFEDPKQAYGLSSRIKAFVLDVWKLCEQLPESPMGKNVVYQLTRSASSVGANFRAAFRGRSGKEFIAKLGIAEEEADECCYWLDLVRSYEPWAAFHPQANELHQEIDQLTAIIVSIIKKKKQQLRSS